MKLAPSSASLSIGSSVPSNAGSPVSFWRSVIRMETGSCCDRQRRTTRQPPGAAEQRARRPRRPRPPSSRSGGAPAAAACRARRAWPARLRARARSRSAAAASGSHAAHDEALERHRNRRIFGAQRLAAPRASAAGAPRMRCRDGCGTALAEEQVVEDQPEGVDVGPLVHRLRRAPVPAPCTRRCRPPSRPSSAPSSAAAARRQARRHRRHRWRRPAPARSVDRATPKSITRPSPSALTMMLAGLRSRCTTPASCATASPEIDAARDASCTARHVELAVALRGSWPGPRLRHTAS